ncbi:MAG TPA: hypothetical protein VIY86_09050, partial [Pirellulaceae bacterium]
MMASARTLVRHHGSRKNACSRPARLRRFLALRAEPLEERCLLAVVTNLGDNGPGSLRDTIATTFSGDTITFAVGGLISLTTGEILIDKNLTIDACGLLDGAERLPPITVSGMASSRVFRVDDGVADGGGEAVLNVTMRCYTITLGKSVQDGGGILSFENLTLEQMTLVNNEVTGTGQDGGAISQGTETVGGGNLVILGSTIENNTAADDAGAIDFYNSGDLTIGSIAGRDTIIRSNQSGAANTNQAGFVGAVRAIDAVTPGLYAPNKISISNLLFEDNKVLGAAITGAATAALGGMSITAPGASYPGGSGWTLDISDSTFSGNTHTLTDNDLLDDKAPDGRGGALYITDIDLVTISDSTFTGNYSYGNGGAVSLGVADVMSKATLTNVTITSNGTGATGRSVEGGGLWPINFSSAVPAVSLGVTIHSSTISGNDATFGGGMMVRQGVELTINDSILANNTSNRGGALYSLGSTRPNTVVVNRSTLAGNTATYGGGAIQISNLYSYNDNVTINNSTISGNVVPGDAAKPADYAFGGGIAVGSDAQGRGNLTVYQSTLSGNSARNSGGAIHAGYYTNLVIRRSTITGNTANSDADPTGYGGGVVSLAASAMPVIIENSILAGNTDKSLGPRPDIALSGVTLATVVFSFIGSNLGAGAQIPESPGPNTPDGNGNLVGGLVNGTIDPLLL